MRSDQWAARLGCAALGLSMLCSTIMPALADELELKKGTEIHLVFDTPLSSKHARVGDMVTFHVVDPVVIDQKVIIADGTKVRGEVVKVSKSARYGINAKIQLKMHDIRAVDGQRIPLGFKTKTGGLTRPGEAAGATVGGAILLGPIGLVGGLFVPGKQVNAKPGDKMTVTADQDVTIHVP